MCSPFTISNIMLFRKSHGFAVCFLIKFVFAIATDIRPCGLVSRYVTAQFYSLSVISFAARFPKMTVYLYMYSNEILFTPIYKILCVALCSIDE